jgi:phage-related protein
MGTELAKAYVQIVPSAKGISGSISKELGREASVAGSSSGESFAGNMLGKVKQLIAVAGIGKVFSETISEGADLEQSLGGIETLFKESADKVKENAAKAYQTAGMSANEYMELTTSFSASLLSSLSNDTSKAADVADMAMTDMSDNANKMGTDMESIKNAYQGFAKQNYTMLDNLKLGYGGTKEEMQRLLTDAQKISGVKYDINNLSDVYNAIHVIQGQLDITGTTAKEASTTISGSLGSMKAAFKNVLGQITLGMDVGPALSALATTTTTFLVGNLLPAIWNILSGLPMALVTFIQTLIPQLIAAVIQFIPGILTAIQTGLPQLYEMANEILIQFTTAIQTNLPALLQQGVDIVTNIVNGILQNIPQMITMAGAAIANFENAIWSALPTVLTAGAQLLINLVNGIIQSLPGIVTAAAQAVAKMVVTIGQHLPEVLQTGIEIIGKLAAGLIRAIPTLLSKLPQIIKGIVNAFTEVDWLSIGINIIKGIGKGLANAGHMLWDAVKDILGNFKDKVLGFFGIHSPSRWGAYVGEMIDLGMARGLINNSKPISDAVNMMQEVVKTPLESSASVSSDQQVAYTGTGIVERLDQLILILGMILNLLKMKDGNVSEREVVRVLREMGVVFS